LAGKAEAVGKLLVSQSRAFGLARFAGIVHDPHAAFAAGASAAARGVQGDAGARRDLDYGRGPQDMDGFTLWFEFDWYFGLAHGLDTTP
jgi:hypothetical protein